MLLRSRLFLSLCKRGAHKVNHCIKIGDKPLGSTFFHPKIQFFLKQLITVDYDRIFQPKMYDEVLEPGDIKFMTDAELKEEKARFEAEAVRLLQCPPIIDVHVPEIEILSVDKSLDGHEAHHCKTIFTDVSVGLITHERNIVVREPNGVLRTASEEERQRMIQMFFPIKGRELYMPKMFEPRHLEEVLDRKEYEFILDRACIQFEPYEQTFHRVLIRTYERVNQEKDFHVLSTTRHFGSFAFYLAANKKINGILLYFINSGKLVEAAYLIQLLDVVHSGVSASGREEPHEAENKLSLDKACKIIRDYISDPSNRAADIESVFSNALMKLEELEAEKRSIMKAHGL